MSSSASARGSNRMSRTQRLRYSTRLFSRNVIVVGPPSSLDAWLPTFSPIRRIICGDQRLQLRFLPPVGSRTVSQRIIQKSSSEVSSATVMCSAVFANHSIAPAKLDHSFMKEPRMVQGVPRVSKTANNARRKPLPKLMNGLSISPP